MDKIQLLDRKFKTMIPAEEIDAAVQRVADKLNERYKGKTPIFLGVLSAVKANGICSYCNGRKCMSSQNPRILAGFI